MKLGITVLRAAVGGLLVGHGAQKLFGWFGGHGPDATGEAFESMGLNPGKRNAIAAGASEAGGGALLALGLMTPLAAAGVVGTMTTAIRTAHAGRGPWVTEGGWEYNAVIIASALAVVADGPGAWSLDGARGRERWGAGWALGALAAGVAGSTAILEQAKRREGQQDQAADGGAAAAAGDGQQPAAEQVPAGNS